MEDSTFSAKLLGVTKPISPAVNLIHVLDLLRTEGALSRADIARRTELTKATASRIISELVNRNLVRVVGVGSLSRGRRPILYEFNTASAIALGIEVRQTECQAIVTKLDATPLRSYTFPMPDTHIDTFISILEQVVATVQRDFAKRLVGIGIGIPGIYDYQQQLVILAERLEWENVNLAQAISAKIPLSVHIVNRANAAALGERWYGAGRGRDDVVFINISSGIKAGIIIAGELYSGSNGGAGEIGHMTIAPDGPVCVCGKRGCLEALASTTAIIDRVKALARANKMDSLMGQAGQSIDNLSRQEILKAAEGGSPLVLGALREAATYIGIAVANVINTFNPERVILGGLAGQAPPIFSDTIKQIARLHTFAVLWPATDIVVAELGQDAVAIGAAALLLSDFLQPSRIPPVPINSHPVMPARTVALFRNESTSSGQ